MANPKVSFIVPVYNTQEFLPRCLDSLLGQTCPDIEIIVVNDGSPDGSAAIIDEYARLDFRVRVVEKSNGGLSSARNAGMDVARGDIIDFVDSDDYVEPNLAEFLVGTFARSIRRSLCLELSASLLSWPLSASSSFFLLRRACLSRLIRRCCFQRMRSLCLACGILPRAD